MNYRHVFHAGNFADVFKHIVLTCILQHLAEKPQPYRVIDTHAGVGHYDLAGALANRTGEWRDGIGRLLPAGPGSDADPLLKPYLDAVASQNSEGKLRAYPGSPLIALALMRLQDRLTACELEPHAAAALARNLRHDKRAKAITIDGFKALNAYLPPSERRGLVLIDPPFEGKDEFDRVLSAIAGARRKWSGGIYMLWYPVKDAAAPAFIRSLRGLGIPKILRVEFHVAAPQPDRLVACGLVIVNPPWRLAEELGRMMPDLVKQLAQGNGARFLVEPFA
jgi:23S rRNA (adenine2030-N6)-methyltransferase